MLRPILFGLLVWCVNPSCYAEARLSIETRQGEQWLQQDVWIAPPKIRVNQSQQAGDYQIFDLQQGKHFVVSESQQQLTEKTWLPLPPDQSATLEKVGAGPRLHGFRTQHYRIKAGEQLCGELWLSADWHSDDAQTWLASWRNLPGLNDEVCTRVAADVLQQLPRLGVPFKINNAQQQLVFQINNIVLNTRILPSSFVLPRIEQQESSAQPTEN